MLLVTPGRDKAIENIRLCAAEGRFNDKTEPYDPKTDPAILKENILRYVKDLDTPGFKIRNAIARAVVDKWIRQWSDGVNRIKGMEKLSSVKGAAFITCNHFNPFDNGIIRTMAKQAGRGRLWAVSQGTNFMMDGLNGFVLRNIDVIPLIGDPSYMNGEFRELMGRAVDQGRFILIYPEQEMWFNYRKPRPGKRGAFLFAAEYGIPVVPCFMEMIDLPEVIQQGFHDVKLVLHILDPIFPDPSKNSRQNSFDMCEADYLAKKAAYESVYGIPLDYTFTPRDIAGWIP
ncbi:MAG: 1-acyl-sn-glycerol-3-phosphate acyltransferase [Bacteroidales bacterium]|nr:1-acyl-sn-glycerol-3-phosphate acyltransferase [Bacteroidales bacterium]